MRVGDPTYPVNLVVAGRRCLVIGGGRVAVHKVAALLEAGAEVTVVAPEIDERISSTAVRCERRPYRSGEVAGYRLAIAATGDPDVNQRIFDDGEAAGVWINAADDPERCSFILPARVRQGRLTVTVSTGGASPALAAWLRSRLADELGPEYDQLIGVLAEVRADIQAEGRSTESVDWRAALDSGILELIRAGRLDAAKERVRACLSSSSD